MSGKQWPRIVIAVPQERLSVPNPEIFYSFWHLAQQGWAIIEIPYTRCDLAHNKAAIELLRSDFTHLLTLDIDHKHPADIVQRLGQHAKADPKKLVIGGVHYRRSKPYDPVAYFTDDKGHVYTAAEFPPGLVKVNMVGGASLLINREVFEQIEYPWFGYDYVGADSLDWPNCSLEELAQTRSPGVDIWFCRRCREAGIDIWVDTTVTSPHLSQKYITKETWDEYRQTNEYQHDSLIFHEPPIKQNIPELWERPGKMLYVGANRQRFRFGSSFIEAGNELTLLEIFPPHAERYRGHRGVERVVEGDVRNAVKLELGKFDSIVWWHGPEHILNEELPGTLAGLETLLKPGGVIVLGMPIGKTWSYALDGNENDNHIGAYQSEDIERLGYAVEVDDTIGNILAWKRR